MQGGMVECTAGSGYHNPAPDQFLIEAVDPQTHLPVADGAPGLLLLTHLDRRGTVMLRYSMGDVAELTRSPCPHCGALTERLTSIPFRVDGLVKIKGMLVNPLVLVDSVNALTGIADFQALVRKQTPDDPLSPDQLIIRLATSNAATDGLVQRVIEAVRSAIRVTPEVEIVDAKEVSSGRGWKAKPLIDERATPA
jgi:phenylacetate-coenzyme A ligase PaaK-like adenylate-forming protein